MQVREPAPRASSPGGFTLIELMIVVAILAIVAAIAVPNLLSARLNANETAAIATLKSLLGTQAEVKTQAAIDVNFNGNGEYGFFAELAGSSPPRSDEAGGIGAAPVVPLLMPAFGQVVNGHVLRSGYYFRIYLPAAGTGAPAGEAPTGGGAGVSIDATLAEAAWCAYAWPSSYGNSGVQAFFVNQHGDVLACRNWTTRYNADTNPVPPNAAFRAGTPNVLTSPPAANTMGKDGQRWLVVQ